MKTQLTPVARNLQKFIYTVTKATIEISTCYIYLRSLANFLLNLVVSVTRLTYFETKLHQKIILLSIEKIPKIFFVITNISNLRNI